MLSINFDLSLKGASLSNFDLLSKDDLSSNFGRKNLNLKFFYYFSNGCFMYSRMIVISENHVDYPCPKMAKS